MAHAVPRRVLLLLPDKGYALRLAAALAAAGHEAACAATAAEGLASLGRGRPALLVADAADPLACTGLLAALDLPGEPQLPVAWLAAPGSVPPTLAAGTLAWIPRPVDAADCVASIEVALGVAAGLAALQSAIDDKDKALEEGRTAAMAVGLLMERLRVDRQRAFGALRDEARARRLRVGELAGQLLDSAELVDSLRPREALASQRRAS